MSTLIYDGLAHTIQLMSAEGESLGEWSANNRTARSSTLRFLPNDTYPVMDRSKPHTHVGNDQHGVKKDSPKGEYGSYGIIRLEPLSVSGRSHSGVGVHSGRSGVPDRSARRGVGPNHVTLGCVRTTDEAMGIIVQAIKNDPLIHLLVINNHAQ